MDAKHVLIDDGAERHPVEGLIGGLPHPVAQIVPESFAALGDEGSGAVVFLPSVDVARFVVAAEEEYFVGEEYFHGEEVGDAFEAGHAAVYVVS